MRDDRQLIIADLILLVSLIAIYFLTGCSAPQVSFEAPYEPEGSSEGSGAAEELPDWHCAGPVCVESVDLGTGVWKVCVTAYGSRTCFATSP